MYNGDILIKKTGPLRDALRQLERSDLKLLLVMDDARLYGTLTDGDIRRYLFRGGKIEDEVGFAANTAPKVARSEREAEELYSRYSFRAIPVVSHSMELLDVYVGDDEENDFREEDTGLCDSDAVQSPFVGIPASSSAPDTSVRRRRRRKIYPQLNIPVVINAGGRGTRLDPFTRVLPKPLIPVGDLPIIEHIMQRFEKYGCTEFYVIVNYKKELIKTYFKEAENRYNVTFIDEDKPLGTGGGLSLLKSTLSVACSASDSVTPDAPDASASRLINSTFFFINCDTILLSDLDSILRFHRENGNTATMICAWKNLQIPYGVVDIGLNGTIEKLREKPELSFLTNTGLYILEPSVIEAVPSGIPVTLPEILQERMDAGERVAAFPVAESDWLDMGQISELEKMRDRLYGPA